MPPPSGWLIPVVSTQCDPEHHRHQPAHFNAPKTCTAQDLSTNIRALIPVAFPLAGNIAGWSSRKAVAVLVLQTRPTRATLIAADLGIGVLALGNHLEGKLDPSFSLLKLGFPAAKTLTADAKPLAG